MPFACPVPLAFNPALLQGEKGVTLKGGRLVFSGDWTQEKALEFVEKSDRSTKIIGERAIKSFVPGDEDKATVKKLLKNADKFDLSKFGFYEVIVADTLKDYTHEKITKPVLDSLALQAIDGVSILVNHASDSVIGHSYMGDVLPIPDKPGEYQFISRFYVPDSSMMPNGQNAVDAIDAGIWKFISIGFRNQKVQFVEPTGSDEYWMEYIYDPTRPPVLVEYSVVYRGAQPRASIKSISQTPPIFEAIKEPLAMKRTLKMFGEILTDGTRKSYSVEVDVPETGEITIPADIQKDIDNLAKKANQVDALSAELKSAKAPVINEIQGIQKKLEQVEDSTESLESTSLESLSKKVEALKSLDAKMNPKNQTKAANPNPETKDENPSLY